MPPPQLSDQPNHWHWHLRLYHSLSAKPQAGIQFEVHHCGADTASATVLAAAFYIHCGTGSSFLHSCSAQASTNGFLTAALNKNQSKAGTLHCW